MNSNTFIVLLVLGFFLIFFILTSTLITILATSNRPLTNNTIHLLNQNPGKERKKLLAENDSEKRPVGQNVSQCSTKSHLPRILNGLEATPNMYPWIVSLRLLKNQNLYDHFCAGVLVSNRVVITAAHCIINKKPSEILAVFGLYRRTDLSSIVMSNSYQISKVIIHENSTENDIAILVVSKSVIFKENIKPICLSSGNRVDEFLERKARVIGWGLRVLNQPSEVLQQTQLTLLNNSDSRCMIHIKKTTNKKLLCALQIEDYKNSTDQRRMSTVCSGDSGGPLFVYKDEKWLLLGIVSFVQTYMSTDNREHLCDPKMASFYTNVGFYSNWINKFMI
ncbi:transmembrane protease serine 9-like [Brachionus plicatilis]|uniref:Transmembrane protease serine 9-like n=1 Tax=Brachionus plicatilis TaxID=10195 RepID=A0A3M7RUA4_BRAPC|nr:transmembrane protease serine 9-like [Brachionus plicatilis]